MAYVLIPPLPPGARKSDYVPVEQRPRTRQRQTAAKGKARAGDNSGSKELVNMLQVAFESNWPGAGSADAPGTGPGEKKTKKPVRPAREMVVVLDDEDEEEEEKEKSKIPTPLDQALAAAFTHNSANPNVVAASASAPGPPLTSGSTRRLAKETRAETLSDSASVEVVIPSSTKRPHMHARAQAVSNRNKDRLPMSPRTSPRGKGKKRHPHTPTSPRRKRQRVADEHEQDDSDDEIEIVVDAPRELRRVPKPKLHSQPSGRHKPRRAGQQHRESTPPPIISVHTSTPSSSPPPQQPSSPVTPPDVNSLAGLPLTILPAPARTEIVIPPRALSHLHASPDPPDPGAERETKVQQMQQHAIRQGFCYEGAAVGAHGLLATFPAAAGHTPPTDSGACATTTTIPTATEPEPGPQHASLDLHLDFDVSMDLGDAPTCVDADAHVAVDDVVPLHPSHPLLRIAGTHDHPDGPMLGFVIPEHDSAGIDAGAGMDLGRAHTSPERDFDLSSLNAGGGGGSEGWIDWRAGHVLGSTSASTDTGVGEYAGDGTIDPSVLGGGGNSPGKLGDYAGSPVGRFGRDGSVQPSHATDEDEDEEEEDVMGLLFENSSDDDLVPPRSGLGKGKGKGKGRAVVVDGGVESPESVAAGAGMRMRRKSWRKALADETEVGHRDDNNDGDGDGDGESDDDDGPRAHAMSAPVFQDARRTKRRLSSSSSGMLPGVLTCCHHCRSKTRRPKMRCTLIRESTDERCRNLFCDLCIEKRYACIPSHATHTVHF